ncbi:MAG: type II secretory ATPase GspE/PulE/Tfp pilus assembly ATPase PilB-like protein [Acidimicrobiales bacterium]|jgi:type II secretory ATPase GspE/PulE/Tfp pilus assembly ATPase PilB-like protein
MKQFDDTFDAARMDEIRRKEEDNLIKSLAIQYGYDHIDLRGATIDPAAIKLVPEQEAHTGNLVVFTTVRKRLSIAIRNPNNPDTQNTLRSLREKGYEVTIFMTSTTSLEHAWQRYHDQKNTTAVKHGVLDIDTDNIAQQIKKFRTPESVAEHIIDIRTLNSARRISETLETMFAGAIALKASDIHIEPEEGGIRLRYRLDGVLHDVIDLERKLYDRLMSRLKLLSGMTLNIRNEAQDGRFTFTLIEKAVEVRSSVIPGAAGESMVMRLLDPTVASFTMEKLGLSTILAGVLDEELKRPNGLIVTTGPTGSGKTTALYAFLQEVHQEGIKIITIENPVEYKIDNIVQTQVSEDYTFESGLRAVLRQDPDVIMVGEIRDREVAETAIHAAQTGHLVFSTLHTNSAVGAFPRLIDLGVDYRMIGSSVNLILGQRLVRVLCENCKKEHAPTEEEMAIINKVLVTHPASPQLPAPFVIYDAEGCEQCNHTGFKGRQGVFEAIRVDNAVEEAVIRDSREHIILEAAKPQGIPTMAEDGIEKVIDGTTSLHELQRVVDLSSGRHTLETKEETVADDTEFSSHIV